MYISILYLLLWREASWRFWITHEWLIHHYPYEKTQSYACGLSYKNAKCTLAVSRSPQSRKWQPLPPHRQEPLASSSSEVEGQPPGHDGAA